jgi:thiamine biosynthesis lipoprotein
VKQTRILMGMPITVEVIGPTTAPDIVDRVFEFFEYVDATFSTYKPDSEISRINTGALTVERASPDMRAIFVLAEQTRRQTNGYFNIARGGIYDPSGIVKGWAIARAAALVRRRGFEHFYIDAGGDIQAAGNNSQGQPWRVGIRNPFDMNEIVKVLAISDRGVATSGTYVRGQHIYNPHAGDQAITDILSLTVIGRDIYDADRFATAAFAMGRAGITFIERLEGFEGYMIDSDRRATFTSGFSEYIDHDVC